MPDFPSHRHPRTVALLAAALTLTPFLTACAGDSVSDGRLNVVASTNVWGDIASVVGGDRVSVRSIIKDPSQDPHSFEADTATLLAASKADVVVENGGGYDDFMDTMLASSDSTAVVINAVDVSGRTAAAGEELNEHVWYDLPTARLVADRIALELGKADPAHVAEFTTNAQAFDAEVQTIIDHEQTARASVAGRGIAITEPVPLYLTGALGLVNETPGKFSEAVEEGDDVAVPVLKETLDLFAAGDVGALVYNEQTSGPITEQVKKAAEDAGVPVVPVTETLPADTTYVEWMTANVDAVLRALGAS